MSSLIVKDGPMTGHRLNVETETTLGRENSDLTIEDPEVSRRHAVLRPSPDGIEIEDQGSTNGTFVNGNRIKEATKLSPGDTVRIGKTTLEVEGPSGFEDTVIAPVTRPDDTVVAATGGTAPEAPIPAAPPPPQPQQSPPPRPERQEPAASGRPSRPQPQNDAPSRQVGPPPSGPSRRGIPVQGLKPSGNKPLLIAGAVLAALLLLAVADFFVFNVVLNKPPSKEDFIEQADSICREAKKDLDNLNFNNLEGLRKALEESVKISRNLLVDLKDLERPEDDQETLSKFFATFQDFNTTLKKTAQRFKRGDLEKIDQRRLTQLTDRLNKQGKDFGFKQCTETAEI